MIYMAIRNPAVAGSFYYYDPKMLHEQINEFVELNASKEDVIGIVSPHAGYMYSGKAAALVYSRIKFPNTFVILGPNHSGLGAEFAIMKEGEWNMPFGKVSIDSNLSREILLNSKILEDDSLAHRREHSIEVQIPFMQFFNKDFQIVPIVMAHYPPDENYLELCSEVGHSIATAIKKVKESVTIVASTDMTHYESHETASKKDKEAINAILELNPKKLFDKLMELNISMCGYGPTAVMLFAAKELHAKESVLVKYMTSGDVTKDYDAVVGYASIIVK